MHWRENKYKNKKNKDTASLNICGGINTKHFSLHTWLSNGGFPCTMKKEWGEISQFSSPSHSFGRYCLKKRLERKIPTAKTTSYKNYSVLQHAWHKNTANKNTGNTWYIPWDTSNLTIIRHKYLPPLYFRRHGIKYVKFIWNTSYLYCGYRWTWRVIIAVNFPI